MKHSLVLYCLLLNIINKQHNNIQKLTYDYSVEEFEELYLT